MVCQYVVLIFSLRMRKVLLPSRYVCINVSLTSLYVETVLSLRIYMLVTKFKFPDVITFIRRSEIKFDLNAVVPSSEYFIFPPLTNT
jgi:hypothetical protein